MKVRLIRHATLPINVLRNGAFMIPSKPVGQGLGPGADLRRQRGQHGLEQQSAGPAKRRAQVPAPLKRSNG